MYTRPLRRATSVLLRNRAPPAAAPSASKPHAPPASPSFLAMLRSTSFTSRSAFHDEACSPGRERAPGCPSVAIHSYHAIFRVPQRRAIARSRGRTTFESSSRRKLASAASKCCRRGRTARVSKTSAALPKTCQEILMLVGASFDASVAFGLPTWVLAQRGVAESPRGWRGAAPRWRGRIGDAAESEMRHS